MIPHLSLSNSWPCFVVLETHHYLNHLCIYVLTIDPPSINSTKPILWSGQHERTQNNYLIKIVTQRKTKSLDLQIYTF